MNETFRMSSGEQKKWPSLHKFAVSGRAKVAEFDHEYRVLLKGAWLRGEAVLIFRNMNEAENYWRNIDCKSHVNELTNLFLDKNAIYVVENWSAHVRSSIKTYIDILNKAVLEAQTAFWNLVSLNLVYISHGLIEYFFNSIDKTNIAFYPHLVRMFKTVAYKWKVKELYSSNHYVIFRIRNLQVFLHGTQNS